MIRSAVTISLVPEARGGPFVFWDGLVAGCQIASKLGFDGVEVFARSAEELDLKLLRNLLELHQLSLAAIGTGAGWVVQRLRLADPDAVVRKRAKEFIAGIVDCAAVFGAPAIVGSIQGRWGEGVSREQALAWLAEGLEELAARALNRGVPLLFEPLNRYETNLFIRVSDTLEFLDSLHTTNVKLLCDLFHMNIEEAKIAEALHLAGPKLGHVHFADSNRQAVGWGHTEMAPIAQVLKKIQFIGYVSAEIFPVPNSQSAAEQTIKAFRQHFK